MDTRARAARRYRARSTSNLLRMGHCAPTVARTLLDVTESEGDWLVRLAGGLAGGVADSGHECGALTAPLLFLGLRYGGEVERGLPVVVDRGHAYCERFFDCNGALSCKVIRDPFLRHCVRAVRRAPELLAAAMSADAGGAIPPQAREAYRLAWAHLAARGFHCAHAVLRKLVPATPELLDATSGFVGGTIFKGMTCNALVGGVMAIGLETGEIERSRLRVLRMIATVIAGGDALAEGLNAFNGTLNRGQALVRWFADAFGSTQCRVLTGCTFSSMACVERFIHERQVSHCEQIAHAVAERTRAAIEASGPPAGPYGTLH